MYSTRIINIVEGNTEKYYSKRWTLCSYYYDDNVGTLLIRCLLPKFSGMYIRVLG